MGWWRARSWAAWSAIALALGAGCADDCEHTPGAAPPCEAWQWVPEPAALELGGGTVQTGFVEMQDGDDMSVVLGPTGLYMITPSIRAWGVYPGVSGRRGNPEDPLIVIEVWLGTELIGGSRRENQGLDAGLDSAELFGIFVPFDLGSDDIAALNGQRVTVSGELTDVCGKTATDALDVVLTVQGACLSCPAFFSTCNSGCDFDAELPAVCSGSHATRAVSLSDCLCAECAGACERSCTGSGSDLDCGACIETAVALNAACFAEHDMCLGGDGCISCNDFAGVCGDGCNFDTVLPAVCAGDATTLATALSDCVCTECAVACELSCSGSGSDVGCGGCIDAAAATTDACFTEHTVCLAGGCLSCNDFAVACREGCNREAMLSTVCPGISTTRAIALSDCVCAECAVACELSCSGTGADVDCAACIDTTVDSGAACSAELSACSGG